MKFTITAEQFALMDELNQRGSCDSLQYSSRGVILARFQTLCVAFCLIVKRCLISLDTGLGKTLVAIAIMNLICHIQRHQPEKMRWLFVVQNNNLGTTYKKICKGVYNLQVAMTNAVDAQVIRKFFRTEAVNADVVVLSYEALCNKRLNQFFYENSSIFRGMIVDESHTIGNGTSLKSMTVQSIMQYMEYAYMLTATPLSLDPAQIINQVYMLDPEMFEDITLESYINSFRVRENGKVIGFRDLDRLKMDISMRFFGVTRKELGIKGNYHTKLILCPTLPEYKDVTKMDSFRIIKGDMQGPAIKALAALVQKYTALGDRGLVYINLNDNKDAVKEYLEQRGVRVGILDGAHTPTDVERSRVHTAFLHGEYDVLLTNITTGRDLPCKYIIFYELTLDFKQFLGRGERGLNGNDMDLYFIIVEYTNEVLYFYNNVYLRGILLETVADKDVDELKAAYQQILPHLRKMSAKVDNTGFVRHGKYSDPKKDSQVFHV